MIEANDIVKVALLIVLEALLSADNAIVLAVMVMPLPHDQRGKALWYGIAGAFAFRIVAVLIATILMRNPWVLLVGGLYLVYLPVKHFREQVQAAPHEEQFAERPVRTILGLSQFWSIAILVQVMDMVFSIDSILAAVAMSRKVWVVITGGIIGIIFMRIVTGKFLKIIERFPALVDGAYIIVFWMGIKLVLEFLHKSHFVEFEIPEWLYLSVIGVIFVSSLLVERKVPERIDETIEESITVLEETA